MEISRIIHAASTPPSNSSYNDIILRQQIARAPELDVALEKLVPNENAKNKSLNDTIVHTFAKSFAEKNANLPYDEKISLKVSKRWVVQFQVRIELEVGRLHGESAITDVNSVLDAIPMIHEKL